MSVWSVRPPSRDAATAAAEQHHSALWSMPSSSSRPQSSEAALVQPPPAGGFNPLRSAHVLQLQLQREAREQAEREERAAAHGPDATPPERPISLFRLPGPLAPATGVGSNQRATNLHNLQPHTQFLERSPLARAQQTQRRAVETPSPLSSATVTPLSHLSPADATPADLCASPPVASNVTPQIAQRFTAAQLDFNSPIAVRASTSYATPPSPPHDELLDLNRQIEEIERQLRGEPTPAKPPRNEPVTPQDAASPLPSLPRSPIIAAVRLPSTPLRDFLSTADRRLVDQYRREQQSWDEPEPTHTPDFDSMIRSPASVFDDPLAIAAALQPASILNDSLPSTIGEERSADTSLAEAEPNADPLTDQPMLNVVSSVAPTSTAPEVTFSSLASSVAPAAPPSTSLSDLMRLSDLAYPELAGGYASSRNLPHGSPWKTKPPSMLQGASRPPLPPVLDGPTPWDRPDDPPSPSALRRLQDAIVVSSTTALSSSRGALDPSSRLLESLWAAEDEFERMLAEELPQVHLDRARMSPHASPSKRAFSIEERTPLHRTPRRQAAKQVHFKPGDFIDPNDRIASTFAHTPRSAKRQSAPQHHIDIMAQDPSQMDGHQFLAVAEWNGEIDLAADAASSTLSPPIGSVSPSGRRNLLLGVNEYMLPDDMRDLLDLDVDSHGRIAKLHPARGFGHLVPLNHLQMAHALEKDRREKEREWENQGVDAATLQKRMPSPRLDSSRSAAGRPRAVAPPQSIYEESQARWRAHTQSLPPSETVCGMAPIPPRASHLHQSADPVAVLKHVELRRVHQSMANMEEDLQRLEERAAALSAEYQSDARELAAYQRRMAARKETLLTSQLNHAQRQWLHGDQNARAARNTLAQIDAIMEARDQQQQRPADAQRRELPDEKQQQELQQPQQLPQRQEPAVHRNVQNSPRPSQPPPPQPSFLAQLDLAPASPVLAHRPAATSVASRPRPSASSNAVAPKARRVIKKKPGAKLEQDLDSALSAAQHLINDFMDKIK